MSLELKIHQSKKEKASMRERFALADPFPHIIIDDFLDSGDANSLLQEHSAHVGIDDWGAYNHFNERKSGITDYNKMGPQTQKVIDALSSDLFLSWLSDITSIEGLLADPDLDGGGLHLIERGGFLNVHVDFRSHTKKRTWSRQLNLLLYLNKNWKEEWDGALQFWDKAMTKPVKKIQPIFNRCVIFETCEGSFHGHPEPLKCPTSVKRRSLALYYFKDEGSPQRLKPTKYVAKPTDSIMERGLINTDRLVLYAFSFAKRYLGLRDETVQKILKKF